MRPFGADLNLWQQRHLKMSALLLAAIVLLAGISEAQTTNGMKLNAGVITEKLAETRDFYTEVLGFGVSFENDFYLLLHTPGRSAEFSFLQPNHPSQKTIFQTAFNGEGVYLTLEVEDVDVVYERLKAKGVRMEFDIRDEPWGDRHFAIKDPNGIGIDIVTYSAPED